MSELPRHYGGPDGPYGRRGAYYRAPQATPKPTAQPRIVPVLTHAPLASELLSPEEHAAMLRLRQWRERREATERNRLEYARYLVEHGHISEECGA